MKLNIGKISIPDEILLKPGKLSNEEFEIIKTHTTRGYDILKDANSPSLKLAARIAYEHHEKFDGTGYPQGLAGRDISIHSRIVALLDVFDALGMDRVYKKAWPMDRIINYIVEKKGKQFDPVLVDVFIQCLPDILKVRATYKDNDVNF